MIIHQLRAPNPGPFTLDGTNSYLIGRVVIDPGPAIEEHVQRILNRAPDLEAVLITHRHADHAPAARGLRERSAARVCAPWGVLDDSVVDVRLEDGMMIELDSFRVEAIATPGHTAEHFCFLSADGDLFTGDMVLGAGTSAVFPPDGNMGDYVASLRKLIARQPSRIHPGHGPVRDDAMELLGHYLSHRMMRDEQIAGTLESGSLSIPELRETIYPDLGPGLEGAADAQLLAHLLYLIERGMVIEEQGRYRSVGQAEPFDKS